MPTIDELQSQINALQSQLNSILGMADDDYIHQYSGEEIDAGITAAAKAVRYDLAQSLTAAQQAQARGNINAAPDGYGLGKYIPREVSNWDDARENGWYRGPAPTGIGSGLLWGRVDALSTGYAALTIYNDTFSAVAQRFLRESVWQPFEWVNPPMELGVEYRTTERFLGKPVYVKTVDLGALPNATIKTVMHGISNVARCVRCCANFNTGDMRSIPYAEVGVRCDIFGDTSGLNVYTPNNLSSITATGTIWVTKTTD